MDFKTFIVCSIIALTAICGFEVIKAERLGNHIQSQQVQINEIKSNEIKSRLTNEKVLCGAANETRDYLRSYFNQTVAQQEAQIKAFDQALSGKTTLDPEEIGFLRLFVKSVVKLENSQPSLRKLHPYAEKDINCNVLSARIISSSKSR